MSDNKDILIKMLADDPKLLDIINSKEHIEILKLLETNSVDFINIKQTISKYISIKKDIILYNILETLLSKELIKEIRVNNNVVYFLTEKGQKLITLYKETKKEFNII